MIGYHIRVSVDEAFQEIGEFDMVIRLPESFPPFSEKVRQKIDSYLEFVLDSAIYQHCSFEFI